MMFEKPKTNHCCCFLFYWVAYVEKIIYRPLTLFFIIVPFSTLEIWRLESERWCPSLVAYTCAFFHFALVVLSSMPLVFAIIILAEIQSHNPANFLWRAFSTNGTV
jgi:hypothetical protein